MHMHVRETEEQGMEADKRREKKRNTEITTARGSDRAAETLVFYISFIDEAARSEFTSCFSGLIKEKKTVLNV